MIITGIGSRNVSKGLFCFIYENGKQYADNGLHLRTGDAIGSDTAFINAWNDSCCKSFYVPNVNRIKSKYHILGNDKQFDEAKKLVESIRPHVKKLDDYSRYLHYRNAFQVLGLNLNQPSDMIVCYAEPVNSKSVRGGTNTAVQIAHKYNIPVYNLWYDEVKENFRDGSIMGLCL